MVFILDVSYFTGDRFEMLHKLHLEDRDVCGVAHVDGKFFVIEKLSNAVSVFDGNHPYKKPHKFQVQSMKDPRDVVGTKMATSYCLYILDVPNEEDGVIWKITSQRKAAQPQIKRYITKVSHGAGTLTMTPDGGLLVSNYMTKELEVIMCECYAENVTAQQAEQKIRSV
jgi:hypothetical protein